MCVVADRVTHFCPNERSHMQVAVLEPYFCQSHSDSNMRVEYRLLGVKCNHCCFDRAVFSAWFNLSAEEHEKCLRLQTCSLKDTQFKMRYLALW